MRFFWKSVCFELSEGGSDVYIGMSGVLARIEKFSNLPVINFFLQLSKQKTSYLCGVFVATKCERKHANQQFNTYLLICKQTREIYEHSHRPVCQYIAPCVIIGLNVICYSH